MAAVLHGHLRTTADLDLYVDLTPENVRRAVAALERLGFRPRVPVPGTWLADPEKRAEWIREKGLTEFSFWSESIPGLAVDLFVQEPMDFEPAYERALRVELDSTWTMVVGIEDLIRMKERTGRPLDLADAEALRAIAEHRRGKG